MNLKFMFLFLFCYFSCTVSSRLQTLTPTDAVKDITVLHKRKFQWMVDKKLDSLDFVLDENVSYIHSNGWNETKQEVINNIKNEKLIYHSIKIADTKVQKHGDTFVVLGKGHFSVSLEGKFIEIPLLYSEVYMSKPKGIKLIHRHACRWNEN